jgi:hypothetical protein
MAANLTIALLAHALAAGEKPAVPDKAALTEAEKTLRDVFKEDYAKRKPDELRGFGQRLLQLGIETNDNPALRYVALRDAMTFAAQGSDAATALKAVDQLAKVHDVDAPTLKYDALSKAGVAVNSPDVAKTLVSTYLTAIEEAVAADSYDAAVKLSSAAEGVARRTQDAALYSQVQKGTAEVRKMQSENLTAATARKTLQQDPNDPAANLTVGRFLCFAKGDWKAGLPLFAKSSDAALKQIAEKEIASAGDAKDLLLLGDIWWEYARTKTKTPKLQEHIAELYQKALPDLKGLDATRIAQRIAELMGTPLLKFVADASMRPFPAGYQTGIFPKQEGDDPLGPFSKKGIFWDQRTGKTVLYEIHYPPGSAGATSLHFRGAAMSRMMIEVLDMTDKVVASSGPHSQGNVWGEFDVKFPAAKDFKIRVTNSASTWLFIEHLKLN